MGLAEFLTYAEAYLIKVIAAAAVPLIIAAIAKKLSTETKGVIDDTMAGLANNFEIACPACKAVVCWDPAPEKEPRKIKPKDESATI